MTVSTDARLMRLFSRWAVRFRCAPPSRLNAEYRGGLCSLQTEPGNFQAGELAQ